VVEAYRSLRGTNSHGEQRKHLLYYNKEKLMVNTQFNYDSVYSFIRHYYIEKLPQFAACEPHAIMNAHLKSAGSSLVMANPGFSQTASEVHTSTTEKFLLNTGNRKALYDDITEMTGWLHNQGYLDFNGNSTGTYRARDLLLRTPSLNFGPQQ